MLGPSLGSKEGEDAGARPHIKNDLVLDQERVVANGVLVALGADSVLQHLLHSQGNTAEQVKQTEVGLFGCNSNKEPRTGQTGVIIRF